MSEWFSDFSIVFERDEKGGKRFLLIEEFLTEVLLVNKLKCEELKIKPIDSTK